jgi:hypothetical protein
VRALPLEDSAERGSGALVDHTERRDTTCRSRSKTW